MNSRFLIIILKTYFKKRNERERKVMQKTKKDRQKEENFPKWSKPRLRTLTTALITGGLYFKFVRDNRKDSISCFS